MSSVETVFQWDERALQQLIELLNKQTIDQSSNQRNVPSFLLSKSSQVDGQPSDHQSNKSNSIESLSILTSDQLSTEIIQLLNQHHRISVTKLSEIIGVNQSIIEQSVKSILQPTKLTINHSNKKHGNTVIHRLYDDLVTSQYVDNLIESVKADLNNPSIGFVSLTNLSISQSIPFEFLRHHVVDCLRQSIKSRDDQSSFQSNEQSPNQPEQHADFIEHGDTLYSSKLVTRQLECLVDTLNQAYQPITSQSITQSISASAKLLDWLISDQIQSLITSGRVNGSITRSANHSSMYIPNSYVQQQESAIQATYQLNHFVPIDKAELDLLQSVKQISKQSLLAALCPNGLMLQSIYINNSLIEPLIELIGESIKEKDYLSINHTIIHCQLNDRDFEMIVDHAVQTINQKHNELSNQPKRSVPNSPMCQSVKYQFIVNRPFVDCLGSRLSHPTETIALDQFFTTVESLQSSRQSNNQSQITKLHTSKQSTKSSKSKQLKGSSNQSTDQSISQSMKNVSKNLSKPLLKLIIQSIIKSDDEDVSVLVDWLVDYFISQMNQIYSSRTNQLINQTIQQSFFFTRLQWKEAFIEHFQDLFDRIVVFNKALNILSSDPTSDPSLSSKVPDRSLEEINVLRNQLTSHLIKTLCYSTFDSMLRYLATVNGIEHLTDPQSIDDDPDVRSLIQLPLTGDQRNTIIQQLKQSNIYQSINQALDQCDMESFISLIRKSVESSLWPIKQISETDQKHLISQLISQLSANLINEQRHLVVCLIVGLILFKQSTGHLIHCPARCVDGLIQWLKPLLTDDAYQSIKQLYQSNNQNNDNNNHQLIEKVRQIGLSPAAHIIQTIKQTTG